ncbi:DEAD/DEAH box helicase [Oenococcus oeni]|uniref:DEAD/DEAH box helicase n=1 Tax=Oenococcus oeni TaxID=1247 RepID=UPI003EE7BE35
MVFKLYDYQQEMVDKIYKAFKTGDKSLVCQLPPGGGKTVIFSEIAKKTTDKNNRVLVFSHRREINQQIEKSFIKNNVDMRLVQIGSVQSFSRNLNRLYPPKLIIVDEAHRAVSNSYMKILDNYPNAYKLLFTATPVRLDGKGFGNVAQAIIKGKTVKWLIDNQHLAPYKYYAPLQIDLEQLKKGSNGEYQKNSIGQSYTKKIYGNVVKNYQEIAKGTQAFLYAYNVESAKKFADEFNKAGIRSASVDGKTPEDKRERIIRAFRDGKIKVITNAEIFLEGFDAPGVQTVIQVRPTTSLAMFIQFSMRSMRYQPNKTATIIDCVNNVGNFGLPDEEHDWKLSGKKLKYEVKNPIKTCPYCFATFYAKDVKKNLCPFCGEELKTDTANKGQAYEIVNTKLVEVTKDRLKNIKKEIKAEIASHVPSDWHDAKSQAQLEEYAKIHGYKHGWAYFKARSMHLL